MIAPERCHATTHAGKSLLCGKDSIFTQQSPAKSPRSHLGRVPTFPIIPKNPRLYRDIL
jgi:hypothetical protein